MRLVVDSDGGIDDAAAITWLCSQPEVELAAVTAVGGNVTPYAAARNLRIVLEAAGRPEVPVYVGMNPSAPAPPLNRPVLIHGEDGLGDLGLSDPVHGPDERIPAVEVLLTELARGTNLLTLGPLTNIAQALHLDPAVAGTGRLTMMGGSARAGGNARPTAEANVAHDPSSAAAVLSAVWCTPPVMVGLDVTHQATLRDREFELLSARLTPAAAFLDAPLAFYRRHAGAFCLPGETPCHDLLAAMAVLHPEMLGTEVLPVAVDTGGSAAWGQTVVDLRELAWRRGHSPGGMAGNATSDGSQVAVAMQADVEFFRAQVRRLASVT
jgi:purine nucleosidase